MNNTNFCSLPFTEIFLGPDGSVKTCCSSRGSIGNIRDVKIEEILQSTDAKSVRQHIIEGKWHPFCYQCQRQENQNARSERANNLQEFVKEHPNISDELFVLKKLDLRWSNTCNLNCTYCYEYFSSKWAQIKGINVNTIKDENEESLFLLIEKHASTINSILMLGGEPLLQKQNIRLINTLSGRSFYVLTNFSVPLETNKVGQLILNEKISSIGVSFENIKNKFEYVRRGANWKTFHENVEYVHRVRPDNRLEAHSLYSIYSAFNLVEFYDYILENNFNNLFWNLLESSGLNSQASIFNLSIKLRERAFREIEEIERQFPNSIGVHALQLFKPLLLKDKTTNFNKQFLEEHDLIETKYLTNGLFFKDIWPEIYMLLQK